MSFKIKSFRKVQSTQILAKELLRSGATPWTVIVAKEQTGGIGRKGERWFSPHGGLYISVILPPMRLENIEILTYLFSFFVAKVIFNEFGEKIFIKFPNDLYFKNKKLGGLMVQNMVLGEKNYPILGIGINTNINEFPEDLKETATSLKIELSRKINNEALMDKILEEIKDGLEKIGIYY